MASKKSDVFMRCNTLACTVELALGKITTVELRNESFVTGKVIEVDGFMNITLQMAEFVDPRGLRKRFDVFFVPCRLIRFVQIPPEIDIRKGLKKLLGELRF